MGVLVENKIVNYFLFIYFFFEGGGGGGKFFLITCISMPHQLNVLFLHFS